MQSTLSGETSNYESFMTVRSSKALTNVLERALEDTMVQSKQAASTRTERDLNDLYEDYNSQTYEDLLATAVLNKVLERTLSEPEISGEGSLDHVGTDTDSGLSGSLRGDALKCGAQGPSGTLSEGSSSSPCHSPKGEDYIETLSPKMRASPTVSLNSPDIGVGLEHTHEEVPEFWEYHQEEMPPLQFKIEEHIEEVTTHHLTDEESIHSDYSDVDGADAAYRGPYSLPLSGPRSGQLSGPLTSLLSCGTDSCQSDSMHSAINPHNKKTFRKRRFASRVSADHPQNLLPSLDLPSISDASVSVPQRVPFPEMGVDLIPECSSPTEGGVSEMPLDNSDWKENWLFKSDRGRRNREGKGGDPITMLIPNPAQNIPATIGDRDIDELSELSDRHSNYSFDVSSDDEYGEDSSAKGTEMASKDLLELVGEINSEFGQKDQEYTEEFSNINKLQKYQNYQNCHSQKDANFEATDVTPIPKPRVTSLANRNQNASQTSMKNVKKSHAKATTHALHSKSISRDITSLKAPKTIPQVIDNSTSSSSTVWFESLPEDQEIPVGRALRTSCQVQAKQACGVSWFFQDDVLKYGKNVLTWRKGDVCNLNVFETSEATCGKYSVCAYTRDDVVWATFQVRSFDHARANKIPRITMSLSDVRAEVGSDLILECQVGGHPEPRVTFIRNSVPLTPSSNCYIENDQYGTWSLRLAEVNEEDRGHFKAIASNSLGHAMTSCTVSILPEGQLPTESQDQKRDESQKKKIQVSVTSRAGNGNGKTRELKRSFSNAEVSNERTYNSLETSSYYNNKPSNKNNNSRYHCNANNGFDDNHDITIIGTMFQPPRPGTIAEREHRKWLEAKPLANNPYSPEKLAHRLGQSPPRFPSLPASYRESSVDEYAEDDLGDRLMSSFKDLSRYSRDYHVNNLSNDRKLQIIYKSNDVLNPQPQRSSKNGRCLVKIESKQAADWKEELKDIKLDVGKKVATIQKTIDAYQHEWEVRLQQKGWNPYPPSTRHNFSHNQKLSASCINLTTPPKTKNRHLIYSSSEALNCTPNRGHPRSDLWRTASVDTLNSPLKFSIMSYSDGPGNHHRRDRAFGSRESISRGHQNLSDSDDSSVPNASSYNNGFGKSSDNLHYNNHYGSPNRKITSYYSENSIESLKEETDTEESLSTIEDSNLPSVKELASKFDSQKAVRNKGMMNRKSHEKTYRPSRQKDTSVTEGYPSYSNGSRKYNNKFPNEVHHSLTARSVSRSFREGLRMHSNRKPPSHLETLTDEGPRFGNQNTQPEQRDTSSPEHLGIPSSPASIPTRHHYSYPTPGDTSDDSMVAGLTPRKNYRKKYSVSSNKGIFC